MIFALRSSHVCWNLPKDLCTSSDICPQQIFARLLIFAQRSLHVCWYWPTDLRTSTDICPKIFARLLIFARRSSYICWYLLADLRTSSDICQTIFAVTNFQSNLSLILFVCRLYWIIPTITDLQYFFLVRQNLYILCTVTAFMNVVSNRLHKCKMRPYINVRWDLTWM